MRLVIQNIFLQLTLIIACSCANTNSQNIKVRLTQKGKLVKVSNHLPSIRCQELGEVYATLFSSNNQFEQLLKGIKNKLKNQAGKLDSNYVYLETLTPIPQNNKTYLIASGTSYYCYKPGRPETLILPNSQDE